VASIISMSGLPPLADSGKYAVEHAETAPADEAIVDRFVWAVVRRGMTPAQAVADHKDDAADDAPSSTLGTPCDNGKYGSIRRICASSSQINHS
jgi:hypothetical protein